MILAKLSGKQALHPLNISSLDAYILNMESDRQIIKCKPIFVFI